MDNAARPQKPKKNRPVVTGISPVEGGPGCKIKIRGEFLGQNQEDVISIKICDIDCTASLEYSTSKCLVTRMGVVERGRPRNIEGMLNYLLVLLLAKFHVYQMHKSEVYSNLTTFMRHKCHNEIIFVF